jgi:poly(3-hydroxybutyrate) depolymerase
MKFCSKTDNTPIGVDPSHVSLDDCTIQSELASFQVSAWGHACHIPESLSSAIPLSHTDFFQAQDEI